MPAVLCDELHQGCLGYLYALIFCHSIYLRFCYHLLGRLREKVLILKYWDEVVLCYFDLFYGELGGNVNDFDYVQKGQQIDSGIRGTD